MIYSRRWSVTVKQLVSLSVILQIWWSYLSCWPVNDFFGGQAVSFTKKKKSTVYIPKSCILWLYVFISSGIGTRSQFNNDFTSLRPHLHCGCLCEFLALVSDLTVHTLKVFLQKPERHGQWYNIFFLHILRLGRRLEKCYGTIIIIIKLIVWITRRKECYRSFR